MKYVPVNKLQEGMTLAMTIYNNEGGILLNANKTLTKSLINRITKLQFKGLYVYAENEEIKYEPMLSDVTRLQALRSLKHINIDDCLFVANTITNNVIANPDVLHELITISSYDNLTYMHSINVATIATMIGVDMGLSNDRLYELSQAALLHDIGKSCIDDTILNKPGKLTDEEYAEMKKHPYYGFEMLKNNQNITGVVRNAIYSHHENEDGSGYPRGLSHDEIHKVAKIIHVADVYDAMISKRSYKERINPADVFEFIMSQNEMMFDESVVKALIHCVALYPIGTEVKLSNGSVGIVHKNTKSYPTRPEIVLPTGNIINLMDITNITIVELITD